MGEITTTVPVVREHKKITDEIDDMYVAAINSAANLRTSMVRSVGADKREYFLIFYRAFYGLYLHTSELTGMESFADGEHVMRWFKLSGPITPRRIDVGLDLFTNYRKELLKNSIVSVSR